MSERIIGPDGMGSATGANNSPVSKDPMLKRVREWRERHEGYHWKIEDKARFDMALADLLCAVVEECAQEGEAEARRMKYQGKRVRPSYIAAAIRAKGEK